MALDDPERRLEGSGNQVRSIRLDDAVKALDDPYIRGLMVQSVKVAGVSLKSGNGQVVLRSTSATSPANTRAARNPPAVRRGRL